MMVDLATATMLLSIHDALPNPESRNEFLKLPIKKMVYVANKLI